MQIINVLMKTYQPKEVIQNSITSITLFVAAKVKQTLLK